MLIAAPLGGPDSACAGVCVCVCVCVCACVHVCVCVCVGMGGATRRVSELCCVEGRVSVWHIYVCVCVCVIVCVWVWW